jgi:polyhydroxyalkanoate synthesis regulator phasin
MNILPKSLSAVYIFNNAYTHAVQYAMLHSCQESHRVVDGRVFSENEYKQYSRQLALERTLGEDQKEQLNKFVEEQKAKLENPSDNIDYVGNWLRQEMAKGTITREQEKQFTESVKNIEKEASDKFKTYTTVRDCLELKDGRLNIKDDSGLTTHGLTELERRVQKLNQYLYGVYNKLDGNRFKQTVYGQLASQFRNWIKPNWNKYFGIRWNRSVYDSSLGNYQKGAYISLFDFIANPIRNAYEMDTTTNISGIKAFHALYKGTTELIQHFKFYKDSMNLEERANCKRAVMNLIQVVLTSAALKIGSTMLGETDDEKKQTLKDNYAASVAMYELTMYYSEISQFVPGVGWYGTVAKTQQSIAAGQTVLQKGAKATLNLMFYPFQDDKDRIYQTGIYKGQDKWLANLKTVTPIARQWDKMSNIASYMAWYKMYNPFSVLVK